MKKLLIVSTLALGLAGCGNRDMFDTNFTYNVAITHWPDGSVREIPIKQWSDYDGEQIQIIATDGTIYLLSMNNTVLVRHK